MTKAFYKELEEFLVWCKTRQPEAVRIMRENNLKLDDLNDPIQKLAFTFYTELCELDSRVRHLEDE
jgi:hypothetical protein